MKRGLEINGWSLKRVVQVENGICNIPEVQKTFPGRKRNALGK